MGFPWHDCESYWTQGFDCPQGLHEEKDEDEPTDMADEKRQALGLPWEWLLPTAAVIGLRGIYERYHFEDADMDKIRRFPEPRTRMPDIPEELAAIIVGVAITLITRGAMRSLGTARAAERLAVSGIATVPPGSARREQVIQSVGVRRSTGVVESPFGKERGLKSGARKKRRKRERGGQAGQFQSFGEWWYQGVDASHTRNFFRGSARFNPADLPAWIQWRASRAQISGVPFGSGFNERWEKDYGFGGGAPWAEGPGD